VYDPVLVGRDGVDAAVRCDVDPSRMAELGERRDRAARRVDTQDPVVVCVGDEHAAVRADRQPMRGVQDCAGRQALRRPRLPLRQAVERVRRGKEDVPVRGDRDRADL
jgi:hypothetical protein